MGFHVRKASQSGSGAPTAVVPDYIGQVYTDTAGPTNYIAFGTSAGNWTALGAEGSGGLATVGSATFLDQREPTIKGGPAGTALKWWTRLFNTEDFNNISSFVELLQFDITEANTGSNYYKVAGDQTVYFPAGHRFAVRGSTGNNTGDTPDVVTSSSYSAGFTTINTTSVTDATVDGYIANGMFRFLVALDYTIRGYASAYKMNGTDLRLVEITGFTFTNGYVNAEGSTKTGPLSARYSATINDVIIAPSFETQISPALDSVWELQHWFESTSGGTLIMGGAYSGTGHGGVANYASINISVAAGAAAVVRAKKASFLDQRPTGKAAGATNAADKWWTRMFTNVNFNNIEDYVELLTWDITEANSTSNYYKVAGDQTAYFPANHRLVVRDSTGNDTQDTPIIVTSSSYAAGETTINVASVVDNTDDGVIANGMFRFKVARDYIVYGDAATWQANGMSLRLAEITGFTFTNGYVNVEGSTKTLPFIDGFSWSGDNTNIKVPFEVQLSPTANSVWELQQWHEDSVSGAWALGGPNLSVGDDTGERASHARISFEISESVNNDFSVHKDSAFLKIGEAEDGVIQAPAAIAAVISGNGKVKARKFDSSTDEDVIFAWTAPDDLDASYGVKFSVFGVITESTAPASGEGVAFQLKGYSAGTGDALGGTPGTAVVSKDDDLNASGCDAQYDVFRTALSEDVTITGLLAGELAVLHLSRDTDDVDDDYAQDVGVYGLLIQFTRERVVV